MKLSKKIIVLMLSLSFAFGAVIYLRLSTFTTLDEKNCAFCNPHVIETHTFYEDNLVRGLCSNKPILPYHCLVVIKRHIVRFEKATEEEITAAGKLLKRINAVIQKLNGPSSYLLLQKNGDEVGQTVPHVHIHYMPTQVTNHHCTATWGLLWHFVLAPFQRSISHEELATHVAIIKKELLKTA
jgi:histidine triad (HIT) family protein